jgi:hypothetical protein
MPNLPILQMSPRDKITDRPGETLANDRANETRERAEANLRGRKFPTCRGAEMQWEAGRVGDLGEEAEREPKARQKDGWVREHLERPRKGVEIGIRILGFAEQELAL